MAYREINLTGWLDPALKYFAEQAGIPVSDYSANIGGEGIGNALEAFADFFTKGWLNKGIQSGAGLIADIYAVWGKDVPMRLRRELLALGTHELLRIVDPRPSDIIEVRRSIELFTNAVVRGDWNAALSSVLRTPAELQAMLGITPSPPASTPTPEQAKIMSAPSKAVAATGTRYIVESEAPLGTAPAPGRYQITD